jgi:hypothetical protein
MKKLYLLAALLLCAATGALAQTAAQPLRTQLLSPAADVSPATLAVMAKSMPAAANALRTLLPLRHITPAMKTERAQSMLLGAAPASALQSGAAAVTPNVFTGAPVLNFSALASNRTAAPPDTNGAVGATQFVQWVNGRVAFYDKQNGALLLGPIAGNTLFADFTGSPGADACRESNFGDPIVQYDKLAKRWILTQFGWNPANTDTGPYYQCIAISTTPDALGSYYRYAWEIRNDKGDIVFNDYPKLSVWPDAYYFTWVLFERATEGDYLGPRACGVDRTTLLAGGALIARCHDFGTAFGPMLSADLDGTMPPPAGSPNYLLALDYGDDGAGDHLFMWRFSFAQSSVSTPISLPVAPFTIACPGQFGGACVGQPAPGEPLDALGDRLMYRLAYRNFGKREALVVNHSVQQPGAAADGPVALRWYEIRNPAGAVGVYQQGTWAPDANSRWMGSIAMDRAGNIALGYSVTGPSTPPGVRYTGRLRSEPPGMLEPEAVIVNGGGVQVDTGGRWGDYSAMTVDPTNDCNFWYTQQYIAATGSFDWRTRIAAFKFGNCQ